MTSEHVDVLIVGAGLSGVCAACHLQRRLPGRRYAILEARDAIGGTWDLFRYPGVRSDSDMFTLGFSFRPWGAGRAIAEGPAILDYVRATARDHGVAEHVRYGHRVLRADWSTADARWTVEARIAGTEETVHLTCDFLFACTGYYRYDRPYAPALPGVERFGGRVVHPQFWPGDLDHAGARVVVVGSGATAVTLVPAMAAEAAHVTMLQRTPSYVLALPGDDALAGLLHRLLPHRLAHPVVRWKNVLLTLVHYQLSRRAPRFMRGVLRRGAARHLPAGFDVDTHFNPPYDPWDQRLCLAPDGDLFAAVAAGRADIVTDRIETFTERGIRLASGAELDADLVVTATGLDLLAVGGMTLAVDGREVDVGRSTVYKGVMLAGVPNLAVALGYTNASWTLKCELTCRYVCRLLAHMDAHGHAQATPRVPQATGRQPLLNLTSGYVQRAVNAFPGQGDRAPWITNQNYLLDLRLLARGPVDDEMDFRTAPPRVSASPMAA